MLGKELKPAKSVITRTPEERIALLDKQVSAITARMRKLKLISTALLLIGLVTTIVVVILAILISIVVVFYGVPLALVAGAIGIFCAKHSGTFSGQLLELSLERRGYVKETKQQQKAGATTAS